MIKKEKKHIHLQYETNEATERAFYTVSTKTNRALSKYSSIAKEAIHKDSKIHGITVSPVFIYHNEDYMRIHA